MTSYIDMVYTKVIDFNVMYNFVAEKYSINYAW
jgi:hypothetical protein